MKTASFVLEEDQIKWIKDEQKRQGNSTASSIVRRLIGAERALQQRSAERLQGIVDVEDQHEAPYIEQG